MTEVLIKLLKQQQEATQLFSNPSFHLVLQILLLLQKNSDKKLKCKVPGCKYKKDISIVKMRLHIAWHIMNKQKVFGGRGYINIKYKFSLRFFGVVVPFSTCFFLKQDGVPNFLFRLPVAERVINFLTFYRNCVEIRRNFF